MAEKKILNKFFGSFVNGVVILLPIFVTVWLLQFLVFQVNNIVLDPIVETLASFADGAQQVFIARVVAFLIVIIVIAGIGLAAKILVIHKFFSYIEKLLLHVPVLGRIYRAAKQIFSAFLGEGKTVFKRVVLIEYPRKGLYSIGFTTGNTKGEIVETLQEESLNVFVPTTPNPTSGIFLVVPVNNVRNLKMSVEEGMKLVVSGGSVVPEEEMENKNIAE